MKISAKAEYACLSILALARRSPDDPPWRIREIAEAHDIPERYLVQILLQLKGSGLVASTRGSAGGYRLARSPESISLGEVLEAIDGPEEPPGSRNAHDPVLRSLSEVWKRAHEAQRDVLFNTTIAELVDSMAPQEWII